MAVHLLTLQQIVHLAKSVSMSRRARPYERGSHITHERALTQHERRSTAPGRMPGASYVASAHQPPSLEPLAAEM